MARGGEAPFDVAIVGAGPAGAALALRLARRGRRVALIERSGYEQARIGETLSPLVQPELHELGLWPDFLALDPLPSWGTASIWGEPGTQAHSHLSSPWGNGWHVDRTALDRLLALAAARSGASLLLGSAASSPAHDGQRWRLRAGASPLSATVLVDASGRGAQMARRLGAQRLVLDPLVGIAAVWHGGIAAGRHHLLVEAVASGWWYSAPLPSAENLPRLITMLMTDADGCSRGRLHHEVAWTTALAKAPATRRRVAGAELVHAPRVHLAQSHRLLRPAVEPCRPWVAVGDAALSVDPLSGSGVLRALQQAARAAPLIDTLLDAPVDGAARWAAHEASMDESFNRYLWERSSQYEREARFETPFWTRRRGLGERLARPAGIEPAT